MKTTPTRIWFISMMISTLVQKTDSDSSAIHHFPTTAPVFRTNLDFWARAQTATGFRSLIRHLVIDGDGNILDLAYTTPAPEEMTEMMTLMLKDLIAHHGMVDKFVMDHYLLQFARDLALPMGIQTVLPNPRMPLKIDVQERACLRAERDFESRMAGQAIPTIDKLNTHARMWFSAEKVQRVAPF